MGSMSHASHCRALVAAARTATLSTLARDPPGHPYGSLVAVAFDHSGRPLMLLSKLAEHTQNLAARPEASILVAEPGEGDPLARARVSILGKTARVPDAEEDAARATFLAAHPEAAGYASFADFAIWRLEPAAIRFIAGFGRMAWVDPADYVAAG